MSDLNTEGHGGPQFTIHQTKDGNFVQAAQINHYYAEPDKDKAFQECMTALFLTNPECDIKEFMDVRACTPGTCSWIEQDSQFQEWKRGSNHQLLVILGSPGKGKSMLAAHTAGALSREWNGDVLFFLCRNDDKRRNGITAVLRGLIYQLLKQHRDLFTHLEGPFALQGSAIFDLDTGFTTLWAIFETMIASVKNPIVIIDGVDECVSGHQIEMLFTHLMKTASSSNNARFLCTSRSLPPTISRTSGLITLDLDVGHWAAAVRSDVEKFIRHTCKSFHEEGHFSNQICRDIENRLLEQAKQTFLWVWMVVESLKRCEEIESTQVLEAYPRRLDAVYDRMLSEIGETRRDAAKQLLAWVATALYPLSLEQLAEALQDVMPSYTRNEDKVNHIRIMVTKFCNRMLQITGKEEVTFIHQTAREYLTRNADQLWKVDLLQSHQALAERCLKHVERAGPTEIEPFIKPSGEDSGGLNPRAAFLQYSIRSWPTHCRHSSSTIGEFFDLENGLFSEQCSDQRELWFQAYLGLSDFPCPPPLHLAAFVGIENLVSAIASKERKGLFGRVKARKLLSSTDEILNLSVTTWGLIGENPSIVELLLKLGCPALPSEFQEMPGEFKYVTIFVYELKRSRSTKVERRATFRRVRHAYGGHDWRVGSKPVQANSSIEWQTNLMKRTKGPSSDKIWALRVIGGGDDSIFEREAAPAWEEIS